MHTHDSFNALLRGELAATETYQQALVRTENVVGRSDSAAKALVGAGGVSPADAESLIAFHLGGKWEYGSNSVRLISCSWRRKRSENTRGWRGASEVWPGRAKEWIGRRKGNEHRAGSNAAEPGA
jgi:hypothetical protein